MAAASQIGTAVPSLSIAVRPKQKPPAKRQRASLSIGRGSAKSNPQRQKLQANPAQRERLSLLLWSLRMELRNV
jgi:hypothetical protein